MLDNKNITPITSLNYTDNVNDYYIKRDDLLPFSFGGNKVRIAIEYFTDLIEKGHDTIISYGNTRSNLNRVIANMSKSLGISCYIISSIDESGELVKSYNTKLVDLMGAKIVYCRKDEVSETIEKVFNECRTQGKSPYYINGNKYGKGNEKVPVAAYAKTYEEILNQEDKLNIDFDYIFHASGTGITQAGLICGKILNKGNKKIVGISVARNQKKGESVISNNISSFLENDVTIQNISEEIIFEDEYLSGGYSKYNNEIIDIINKVLKKDGIPLDNTYTGKAFWGMTKYIKEKNIKNAKILFIHTGGAPLFFDDLI